MANQVRDTAAGKSISADIVLNKRGEHVATVQAHFSNGGAVTVDVWNQGDAACCRSLATARKTGAVTDKAFENALRNVPGYYSDEKSRDEYAAYTLFGLQQGRAGGYGYDKFASALAGLIIDGHTMADHCGTVPEAEKARARLFNAYCKAAANTGIESQKAWDAKAYKIGARFANWDSENNRYSSLHFTAGMDRLTTMGYRVISAI